LAKFDGINWDIYNAYNSGLPHNYISEVAISGSGSVWIGTVDGLAKFDGTSWTNYNTYNSDLPDNDIHSLYIAENGTKWIGTSAGGLAKFDGSNWTIYNTSNSGLPSNNVLSIAIDGSGSKWIGTLEGGLAIFNENGNPGSISEKIGSINKVNISPNPLLHRTSISYTNTNRSTYTLSIFNISGNKVFEMDNIKSDKIEFERGNLPEGVYLVKLKGEKVLTGKMVVK